MTYTLAKMTDSFDTLSRMSAWVTSGRAETPEDVAFLSGAGLNHLHLVLGQSEVPQPLLRARLALRAAEVCVAHAGRVERAGELRDAVAFLQPGDTAGPAGEVYQSWRRAVERPVSIRSLSRALPDVDSEQIAVWLDVAGLGVPVARAAAVV